MKPKELIKKFLKFINPLPPVGGLAVTDNSLRFLLTSDGGKFKTAALKLPPDIILNGKIKDAENLKLALKNLHAQIVPMPKPVHVILNLPAALAYTQVFSIPLLAEDRLAEAAALNLQMISPIDFSSAYSGWQKVGESFAEGGELELLGAFAEAARVDEFSRLLAEANFMVTAVEFPALALARVVGTNLAAETVEPLVLINAASDGVTLMILKNGNLYFSHFHSWNSIQEEIGGKKISENDFRDFITRELQKVLNFYSSHWGGSVGTLILVNPNIGGGLIQDIEKSFSMKVKILTLKDFPNLAAEWFSVLGSALRGVLPRGRDTYLSLTTAPVQIQYREARTLNFISLWRKIAITALAFILVLFGAVDIFFLSRERELEKQIQVGLSARELAEIQGLQAQATAFNQLVNVAFGVKSKTANWSEFFARLTNLRNSEVFLSRVNVSGLNVALSGTAENESAVLGFKDRLLREENFEAVSLPITNINANPDGTVSFNLTFKLKTLKF